MPERSARNTRPNRQIRRAASVKSTLVTDPRSGGNSGSKAVEKMAQVRLRADEAESLGYSMQVLEIGSTSEALREGLRLLHREATEVEAASNIRAFYQGESAPLPEGVMPVDEADLLAADSAEW
jgi:hypothetical protein